VLHKLYINYSLSTVHNLDLNRILLFEIDPKAAKADELKQEKNKFLGQILYNLILKHRILSRIFLWKFAAGDNLIHFLAMSLQHHVLLLYNNQV